MQKTFFKIALIGICVALSFASCSKKSIEGTTWKGELKFTDYADPVQITLVFTESEVTMTQKLYDNTQNYKGTYSYEDPTVIMTLKDSEKTATITGTVVKGKEMTIDGTKFSFTGYSWGDKQVVLTKVK